MYKAFPIYRQLDAMDCGPTTLQMVAKYYGRYYSLPKLRSDAYLTREGVSLLSIAETAEKIGFRSVGVKITVNSLQNDVPLPCILHWNQNHFVVLYKVGKNKIFIADPAAGKLTYSFAEFSRYWQVAAENSERMGVALLLEPTPAFYEKTTEEGQVQGNEGLASLLRYLKSYRKFVVQLFIGLLTGSLIQLLLPFLTQSIVDIGINTQNINFVYLVLAGQMMLFVGRTSVDFIRRWILLHLSTRINISIISDFLSKLFKLPIAFFEGKMIGDILRRIDDHSRVERFISTSSLNVLFSLFNVVIFGMVLGFYSLTIFLVFFLFSALYVVYVLLFMEKRAKLDYKRFQQLSDNESNLIQTIQGMAEIKLNNCETQKRWQWERIQAKLFHLNVAGTRLQQFQDAGSLFINESKNIIITVLAALAVMNGSMTLGMMLAVQYIIGQLNAPVADFINFTRDWQDAKLSLARIQEVQLLENEEKHDHHSLAFGTVPENKTLILDNVTFHYEGPNSPAVLKEIDLIIPEGKITAIVGTSGSGKTTLMKLLLRFYEPSVGKITVGGVELGSLSARQWRKKCGVVMQDGTLFNDTITANICMTDDQVDFPRLMHAVQVAQIHDFIKSRPLGFTTKIGMNGMGLSQGQKQRILIARAVYKNPEVLFFDEATSALDTNNEKAIMENLDEFYKGKTVLVIAHRLSTVKNADQIVVLEGGKIVEVGNHYELVELKGSYFELVKNQLELEG